MKKYCKFLEDIYDNKKLIWEKDKEYLIIYEDNKLYCFGEPIINGIEKILENKKFKVIIKD